MAKAIETLAKKSGLSQNKTIKLLLRQALQLDEKDNPKRDLSSFYGIWTEKEAAQFEEATAIFNSVDEDLGSFL